MKSRNKPQSTNFIPNPGLGWVFFDKAASDKVSMWAGNLTLPDGQRVRLQGIAVEAPKSKGGRHYEFKVLNVDPERTDMWKNLGEFEMPAFGERRAQIVETPVGRMRVWRQMPRPGVSACIRFRVIQDASGERQGPVPM